MSEHIKLLQSYCSINKLPQPYFHFIKDEGPDHNRLFTYECKVKDIAEAATGSSKSLARQLAAEKVLKTLKLNVVPKDNLSATNTNENVELSSSGSVSGSAKSDFKQSIILDSFMQRLVTACTRRGLPLPTYTVTGETGPPHLKVFTSECCVKNMIESGSGSSKSRSKQSAAEKMLRKIESLVITKTDEKSQETTDPIQLLQAFCSSQKLPSPSFSIISVHGKEITYECRVGELAEEVSASSDVQAKHLAAAKVLEKLRSQKAVNVLPNDVTEKTGLNSSNLVSANTANDVTCNKKKTLQQNSYMQRLVTECCRRCEPLPVYTLKSEKGPPHLKTFTFQCCVSDMVVSASATSKALSKQLAAKKMLQNIDSFLIEQKDVKKQQTAEPLQLLQTFCLSQKLPIPIFRLIRKGDFPNSRLLTYECEVGDIVEEASAASINLAKHFAAAKVLEKLMTQKAKYPLSNNLNEKVELVSLNSVPDNVSSSCKTSVIENSFMQRLVSECSRRWLPLPKYVLNNESGPPHLKVFTFDCIVGEMVESASASSKSLSQQLAAEKMLEKIESLLISVNDEKNQETAEPLESLQSFCSKEKLPMPSFSLIRKGEFLLTYECRVADITEKALAATANVAKYLAATKLLEKLVSQTAIDPSTNNLKEKSELVSQKAIDPSTNNLKEKSDLVVSLNSVPDKVAISCKTSVIQNSFMEHLVTECSRRCLPLPKYVLNNESGPHHLNVFTCKCCVGEMVESASASSESLSKLLAAEKMLEKIDSLLIPVNEEKNKETTELLQLLQVFCSCHELSKPTFTLIKEGEFLITYECRVGDIGEEASAESINLAKHFAATKVLEKLISQKAKAPLTDKFQQKLESMTLNSVPDNVPSSSKTSVLQPSFMQRLVTECSRRCLPLPKYVLSNESGPPHLKVFTFECIIEDMVESASASSKSSSKQLVAEKMLERVETLPIKNDHTKNKKMTQHLESLQNVCSLHKLPKPAFKLLREGGSLHHKLFTFECTVGCNVEVATASCKGQAKQLAAAKVLEKLGSLGECIMEFNNVGAAKISNVQELQKYCSAFFFPSPLYEYIGEETELGVREFSFKCQVSNITETASANSKKEAKDLAAERVLKKLKSQNETMEESDNNDVAQSFNASALELYADSALVKSKKFPSPEDVDLYEIFSDNPSAVDVIKQYNENEDIQNDVVDKVVSLVNNTKICISFDSPRSRNNTNLFMCLMMPHPYLVTYGCGPKAKQISAHKMMCTLKSYLE